MNDLQLSLLAIGAAVIAGIYVFNRIQEYRYRLHARDAFGAKQEDVLLKNAQGESKAGMRVEPGLGVPPPSGDAADATAGEFKGKSDAETLVDPIIDYAAQFQISGVIPGAALRAFLDRRCGKPVHWVGFNSATQAWEEAVAAEEVRYGSIRAGLQLADRFGPATSQDLAEFISIMREAAVSLPAALICPDQQEALARAQVLNQFCAELDVLIGVNLVARDGQPIPATKIRALCEAFGFRLDSAGSFQYLNDQGQLLFALANLEQAPFLPQEIKTMSTRGVTLVLDVPRAAGGSYAFERLIAVAKNLANNLGCQVVDDKSTPLSDAAIERIGQRLDGLYARMDAAEVPGGSALALRLFA